MELSIKNLSELLNANIGLRERSSKIFIYRNLKCVVEFPVITGTAALDLEIANDSVKASLVGRDIATRRLIRNAFLIKFNLRQSDGERMQIPESISWEGNAQVPEEILGLIEAIQRETMAYLSFRSEDIVGDGQKLPIYWWDGLANFGDSIGPLLVSKILGVSPVNARQWSRAGNTLYSVGSITTSIDRDDVTVWGSGLLAPLSDRQIMNLRQRKNVRVLAVRGKYTQLELESKLGWQVPSVYGDPALLLPKFYPVERDEAVSSRKIALILHWEHAKHLENVDDGIDVINVGDDARLVVEQIAASSVCISSSLHGIIVAQAYGIPWIWLQVSDHKLHSSNFKFDDFFSTLDRRQVCKKSVTLSGLNSVSWEEMADSASLPDSSIDLSLLEQALVNSGISSVAE